MREDPDLQHEARREDAADRQRSLFGDDDPEKRRQAVKDARFEAAMLARKSRRILPYAPDSATSKAAAEAAREWDGAAREKVLILFDRHPAGLTDHELYPLCPFGQNTARPRRFDLCEDGILVKTGTRELPNGNKADVHQCFWHAESHDRYGLAIHREHIADRGAA